MERRDPSTRGANPRHRQEVFLRRILGVSVAIAGAILVAEGPIGCSSTSGSSRGASATTTPATSATALLTAAATATPTHTSTKTITPTLAPPTHLVAAGGYAGGGTFAQVYSAPILSGGALGTWTTQAPLPVDLGLFRAVNDGGHFVAPGGLHASANNTLPDVRTAIVSSGSISGWGATTALPDPRYSYAQVRIGSDLFLIAGEVWNGSGTLYSDVYSASLTGTGSVTGWNTTTSLPIALAQFDAATDGSYIYTVGGYDGNSGGTNAVYAGAVFGGTVISWSSVMSLPTQLYLSACFWDSGTLYSVGGYASLTSSTSVYAATASGGNVGGWTSVTPLPVALSNGPVVVAGSYVYYVGGMTGIGTAVDWVYFAPITGGSLGAWNSTTPLPATRSGMAVAAF